MRVFLCVYRFFFYEFFRYNKYVILYSLFNLSYWKLKKKFKYVAIISIVSYIVNDSIDWKKKIKLEYYDTNRCMFFNVYINGFFQQVPARVIRIRCNSRLQC